MGEVCDAFYFLMLFLFFALHADYHDPTSNYNARLGYGTDQVSESASQ